MKNVLTVASYINNRYLRDFGTRIEEMKLHKLMYFAQRESLIQTDKPLFDARIEGWRLGPVLPELRDVYKTDSFDTTVSDEDMSDCMEILDYVFAHYAVKEALSLSRLSRGEICWRKSRKGIPTHESSNNPISLDDIRLDAFRIVGRRVMLEAHGLA